MEKSVITSLAILLFFCLLSLPYGYFQFVRFTAMVGFCYLAFVANGKNNNNEMLIYLALAILFQPFVKIALGRTAWNIVDVVLGIALIVSVFKSNNKKLER